MKVTLPTRDLLEAVSHASSVAASKSPKQILECIVLRAETATGLTLEATDMDVGVRLSLPEAKVTKPGVLVIPANRLHGICREVDEDEVTLTEKGGGLVVDTGRSHFEVRGEPVDEVSPLPDFPASGSTLLPGDVLSNMIRRTTFATAKEAGRYALHGVQFQVKGKDLQMIATDGRRLARIRSSLPKKAGSNMQAIIGPKALQTVERVLASSGGGDIELALEERRALFRMGSAMVVSRLIDGIFPSMEGVIPESSSLHFQSTAAEFANGLRRASLLTTRDAQSVELQIDSGSLVIRSRARDVGEAKVEIPVEYDGDALRMGFNPAYLQEALRVMDPASAVRFEFSSDKSPGTLTDSEDYTYVVMPISLE